MLDELWNDLNEALANAKRLNLSDCITGILALKVKVLALTLDHQPISYTVNTAIPMPKSPIS